MYSFAAESNRRRVNIHPLQERGTMMYKSIAIDGPAGAGKTTQAKILARKLGFVYVDTGALYRTIAVYAKRAGLRPEEVPAHLPIDVKMGRHEDGSQVMYLDGKDVTGQLRTEDISKLASDISAIPAVRAFLLDTQRQLARENNVVMEGRDIGTVILPNATLKVFLTAGLETRAVRRGQQLGAGVDSLPQLIKDMEQRDRNDSSRDTAPLEQAEDAIFVDCSEMDIEQTTEVLLNLWAKS